MSISVGQTLPNGATVLQFAEDPQFAGGVIILALWRDEFVTWAASGPQNATYWGHYFDQDLTAALVDFERRARGDGEQFSLWVEALNERVRGTR